MKTKTPKLAAIGIVLLLAIYPNEQNAGAETNEESS